MAIRHVYLKIEEIVGYSSVEPSPHAAARYRRDCMRNTGHEDASIPLSEVNARSVDAVVYREYLDAGYLVPKPDRLVLADVNEPIYTHRVPGTVIYAHPGERLHIHVLNADVIPHSFTCMGCGMARTPMAHGRLVPRRPMGAGRTKSVLGRPGPTATMSATTWWAPGPFTIIRSTSARA
jgi:hypothetical protein